MTATNTIETTEDLLRIARENAEFRAALRRELLTEDLLALPSQFAKMLETQNRMLAELTETRETQAKMLETQNRMLAELAETRETQANMLEEQAGFRESQANMLEIQNRMLAEQKEMRVDLHSLHRMYRQQHEDMGRFRGNYAFSAMRRNQYDIARPFSRLMGFRRMSLRPLTSAELSDILRERYESVDALGLRDRSWETFQNPDLIAEVTGLINSKTGFYIAVEASYTGDREDALRASDHAKILRHATGKESYAVVAAVRLGPGLKSSIFNDVSRFVEARDEDAVLWHQLDEERLEPLDPC